MWNQKEEQREFVGEERKLCLVERRYHSAGCIEADGSDSPVTEVSRRKGHHSEGSIGGTVPESLSPSTVERSRNSGQHKYRQQQRAKSALDLGISDTIGVELSHKKKVFQTARGQTSAEGSSNTLTQETADYGVVESELCAQRIENKGEREISKAGNYEGQVADVGDLGERSQHIMTKEDIMGSAHREEREIISAHRDMNEVAHGEDRNRGSTSALMEMNEAAHGEDRRRSLTRGEIREVELNSEKRSLAQKVKGRKGCRSEVGELRKENFQSKHARKKEGRRGKDKNILLKKSLIKFNLEYARKKKYRRLNMLDMQTCMSLQEKSAELHTDQTSNNSSILDGNIRCVNEQHWKKLGMKGDKEVKRDEQRTNTVTESRNTIQVGKELSVINSK